MSLVASPAPLTTDHLGGEDWWDKHRLGYGAVTTVASLQHWASRLKMAASVAKCPDCTRPKSRRLGCNRWLCSR
jgi:hypothetical protein